MSDIDFVDKTNALPSQQDFDDAIQAVNRSAIRNITQLPPELGVNMPNILRCLKAGKAIFLAIEKNESH